MSRYKISNPSKNEGVVSVDGKWTTLGAGKVLFSDRKPGDHTKNIKVSVMAEGLKSTVSLPKAGAVGSLKVASKADAERFSAGTSQASPSSSVRVVRAAVAAVDEAKADSAEAGVDSAEAGVDSAEAGVDSAEDKEE